MLQGCREGNRRACGQLIESYLSLAEFWIDHYFPVLSPHRDQVIVELLKTSIVDPGGLLKSFQGTWEREFLREWRLCTLRLCWGRAVYVHDAAPTPLLRDQLAGLLKGFPLLHQQLLWFHMCRFPAGELAQILSMRPEVVEPILSKARARAVETNLPHSSGGQIPTMPPKLLVEMDSEKSENCVSIRLLSKIIDGQALWAEKEKAEGHTADCLYCLSNLTALKETILKLRTLPAANPLRIDNFLNSTMGRPEEKKSFGAAVGKLFKRV
ncbi:MAG: hypothetical protein LAO31_00970 [Acidobacteriia bacterium]|nr:hypothetical protein [Terriglobia bacterium]